MMCLPATDLGTSGAQLLPSSVLPVLMALLGQLLRTPAARPAAVTLDARAPASEALSSAMDASRLACSASSGCCARLCVHAG
jgi:hypothetical protein